MATPAPSLGERTDRVLADFLVAAREALGDTLDAVVLYGSAAEGRLRPTSDVNVILVLSRYDDDRVAKMGDAVRLAQAAVRLAPMLLLREEIPQAAAAFAVKFSDIAARYRVLYGTDPFANLVIPRERLIARLQQVLLNLRLRLRAASVTHGAFEDALAREIANAGPPLRSAAATFRELDGQPRLSSREALIELVRSMGDARLVDAVAQISVAREQGVLPPGVARTTLRNLIDLAARLHARATQFDGPTP